MEKKTKICTLTAFECRVKSGRDPGQSLGEHLTLRIRSRGGTLLSYCLSAVVKKAPGPGADLASDSVGLELVDKKRVANLVEGL